MAMTHHIFRLDVNLVSSNDAVLVLVDRRVPRDLDRAGVDWARVHVLRLAGN